MSRARLSDVIDFISANAEDSGLCATNPEGQARIIAELNMALPILMKRVDTDGALWWWAIPVCGGCFSLPEDCLEARQIFVNGFGTIQRDKWYQGQLSMGLNNCGTQCGWSEVIDLGDFPTPQPLPNYRPIFISVSAESNADVGKEVVIEIVDQYGKRQKETLILLPEMEQSNMLTAAVDVTFVGKPQTEGSVRVYLNYASGARYHYCDYGPNVQVGTFRRKKLPAWCPGTNLIRVYGKMRVRKIDSINDIIPISDPVALSWALSAITALRRKDPEAYNNFLALAVNELLKDLENKDSASNVHPIFFDMGACSPSQASNRRCWN